MSRQEFLETLGRALKRELSDAEVADNVRYYENYIDQEIKNGKSEAQVLIDLGDPRLIAKTILQVDQQREEEAPYGGQSTIYTEGPDGAYSESEDGPYGSGFEDRIRVHTFRAKTWLILLLVLIIVCIVLGTVFTILWKLLPFIVIVSVVLWLYRRFFS